MKTISTNRTYTSPQASIIRVAHLSPLCGSETAVGTESITETTPGTDIVWL